MISLCNSNTNRWLFTIAIVLSFYQNGESRILNAYEGDAKLVAVSIKNIEMLLLNPQTAAAQKRLMEILGKLKAKELEMQVYKLRTASAIATLRAVDPILFDSVDNIKDRKGNITNIYVKIVPEAEPLLTKNPKSAGYSLVSPSEDDPDVSSTQYGNYTAYVEVKDLPHKSFCYSNIFLLAHEFGHLIYEVPNLAEYSIFYHVNYNHNSEVMGHQWNDPSGKSVGKVIRSFLRHYRSYKEDQSRVVQSIVAKA